MDVAFEDAAPDVGCACRVAHFPFVVFADVYEEKGLSCLKLGFGFLDGDFFDDDASYTAGDFVLRMPGTQHRAGSKTGCTMLIIYAPLVEARA